MSSTPPVRVYLPSTLALLARVSAEGVYARAGAYAHAVTPALREWYVDDDIEELELAAMLDAAEQSLRLIAADPDVPRRRVVVAVDVPEGDIQTLPDAEDALEGDDATSIIVLGSDVQAAQVISVHVDDAAAEADVAAAADALPAAARGDEDAVLALGAAEDHDLLWYDASEISDLLPANG